MARMLSLDIGFDRDLLPNPANYGSPLLQAGLTLVDEVGNPIALARRLKRGDRLLVTFYDLTSSPANGPGAEVHCLSFGLQSRRAKDQDPRSPFSDPESEAKAPSEGAVEYMEHELYPTVAVLSGSTVFEGDFPAWRAYPPPGHGRAPAYPNDQLHSERNPPRMRFQVMYSGHFYMTYVLQVLWQTPSGRSERRTFRVDPEMIIDDNGSPDGPG